MRVWLIQIGEPLPSDGLNVRLFRVGLLAEELQRRGHEVVWWTSTFNHFTKKHRYPRDHIMAVRSGYTIRMLHSTGYSKNVSPIRLVDHAQLAWKFSRQAKREPRPDIIHCSFPTIDFSAAATSFGRRESVPVVLDVQDIWPDVYLTAVPRCARMLAKILLSPEFSRVSRAFKRAVAITAVSKSYLSWGLRHAERERCAKDEFFPLGYQDSLSSARRERVASERLSVAYAGGFGYSYDLETVIKAARLLRSSSCANVHIVFAGCGEKEARLRAMASGLPNVEFTGWLDSRDLTALLGNADVGLCAYARNAVQSLPNKPFEYMANGLALLSSLRGELEKMVLDNRIGLQYNAGDPAMLAKMIQWLAEHPEKTKDMGNRARQLFKERYSSDVIAPGLAEHMERIVLATKTNNTTEAGG